MGSLLLAVALLGMPVQDEAIGELSPDQFYQVVRSMGYVLVEEEHSATLIDGAIRSHLSIGRAAHGVDAEPFVSHLNTRLEFNLPRSIPKQELQDWRAAQGLERMTVGSSLGGLVYIESSLQVPNQTIPGIRRHLRGYLDACSRLAILIEARGGKPSTEVYGIGKCPYEPNFKLDWLDGGDLEYMRLTLKWGDRVMAPGKNLIGGAHPLGIPIVFSATVRSPRITLTAQKYPPDVAKVDRFLLNPIRLDWADYHEIKRDRLWIQKSHEFPHGVTVRELESHILDFARKVKALDLF